MTNLSEVDGEELHSFLTEDMNFDIDTYQTITNRPEEFFIVDNDDLNRWQLGLVAAIDDTRLLISVNGTGKPLERQGGNN